MRQILRLSYAITIAVVVVLNLALTVGAGRPASLAPELLTLFPARIGDFRQVTPIRAPHALESAFQGAEAVNTPEGISGEAEYKGPAGERFLVQIVQFHRDSDAYSLLTIAARSIRESGEIADIKPNGPGTASAVSSNQIVFCKGTTFVRVGGTDSAAASSTDKIQFAHTLADQIANGEGDIPVLLKHVPEWQTAQQRAVYFSTLKQAQVIAPDQPILSAVNAAGDADAVLAGYPSGKLLIIEFNTPQLAADNDRQINARIEELRKQNQPSPSAYSRVGNYAVFVFNADNEQIAQQLIGQIQYEQVVQWLGENPYWLKEAQRRYTETTLGVLVAVVKASGLTLMACFGLGAAIGTLLFTRRRARQANRDAFSDAGGMLRLNLDEMTPQPDPRRLLPGRN